MKMGVGKETLRSFALTLRPSAFKNAMILGKAALRLVWIPVANHRNFMSVY
jgi:hypothetical protein